jgi:uncharacterized protein (TIGR02145 family)
MISNQVIMKIVGLIFLTLILICCKERQENNYNFSYGQFTDPRDSITYKTIQIGSQIWMAENLNYNAGVESWGYFGNTNSSNALTYGRLYSWRVACEACPDGWHLPSDDDWKELEMYLGMSQIEADSIAERGERGTNEGSKLSGNANLWFEGSLISDSEFGASGFSGRPAGFRWENGSFEYMNIYASWWTSNEFDSVSAYARYIYFNETTIDCEIWRKPRGCSVRCIMD